MHANDPRLLQPGELVRIVDNPAHTFRLHAGMPGIYLGKVKIDQWMHTILLSGRKVYFAEIEGNFEKAS